MIGEEYRVRRCWGDRPAHEEYQARFPGRATELVEELRRIDAHFERELARPARVQPVTEKDVTLSGSDPSTLVEAVSVSSVVDMARDLALLTASQQEELEADLQNRYREPMALGRALMERGWLTPYQVNQLLRGRGGELVLGPYLFLERLGEGGTGRVYKALHRHMNRLVAVKLLRRELLVDPEVVARFYREIQVVSRLGHPNVIHAYDAGPIGAAHGLVMEYTEGTNLAQLVKRSGPLAVEAALDYVAQAAQGLQHIHEQGLVHRDIKPSNLLLTRNAERGTGNESDPSSALRAARCACEGARPRVGPPGPGRVHRRAGQLGGSWLVGAVDAAGRRRGRHTRLPGPRTGAGLSPG